MRSGSIAGTLKGAFSPGVTHTGNLVVIMRIQILLVAFVGLLYGQTTVMVEVRAQKGGSSTSTPVMLRKMPSLLSVVCSTTQIYDNEPSSFTCTANLDIAPTVAPFDVIWSETIGGAQDARFAAVPARTSIPVGQTSGTTTVNYTPAPPAP